MDTSRFNTWKYRHDGPGLRQRWQLPLAAIGFIVSLAAISLPFLAFPAFIIALLALFVTSRKILLGSRYLICGGDIIYYANVQRIDRDNVAGRLSLSLPDAVPFTLEREKFPTNARKADKIRRNRDAKFAKVADRIVLHVQAANPAADIRVHC